MALSDIRFYDKPNQPTALSFPKRTFGKKKPVKRAFQPSWFKSWSWLHYDEALMHHFVTIVERQSKKVN